MQEIVYHTNFEVENSYFWFLSRNEIISKIISKLTTLKSGDDVIDIGCGTGGFASVLAHNFNVCCLDMEPIALDYCKKRGLEDRFLGSTTEMIETGRKFKTAFMLDVIEHIEDDKSVVADVFNLLEPGGYFVAAVPAYQWMWSGHDEMHMHFRRYSMKSFLPLFENAGFDLKYQSYFNTFLCIPAIAKRMLDKFTGADKKNTEPVDILPEYLNKFFKKIFSAEKYFLPKIKFPFGLSILVVVQKPKK